ncbi:MAG: succinate dehydrogenase iron-sulfur subunit [Thermodesulfovibrio sp.]
MSRYYTFKIKRYLPDENPQIRWDQFRVKLNSMERVLDGLIKIKETMDGTLTFRKSCAHGVCGSCAMKINGKNRLACQTLVKDLPEIIEIEPLPSLPVIKDLVVDMSLFFEKNDKVLPYLINDEPPPERERIQFPEDQHKILESITCIMCGSCTSSCPVFWTNKEYLGPSALLKAYRFLFDTRDRATEQRLQAITGENGIWRCHSIFNCVEVCPKEIDITKHLLKLKRLAVKRGFKGGSE